MNLYDKMEKQMTESQSPQEIMKNSKTPLDTVFFIEQRIALLYIFMIGIGLFDNSVKVITGGTVGSLFKG